MEFRAHIQNGRVVADSRIELPDGTPVRVVPSARTRPSPQPKPRVRKSATTFAARFSSLIGVCRGLPKDAASRVDDYLYREGR